MENLQRKSSIQGIGAVERKVLTNAEVLAMDKVSNANKFVVSIAEAFGIDKIFVENDYGYASLMTTPANELLSALDASIIAE